MDVISLKNVTMMLHTCFSVLRLEEVGGSEKCQRICLNLNQSVNICESRSQLSTQAKKTLPQGIGLIYKYCDLMMIIGRHNIKSKLWAKAGCKLSYWP